MPAHHQQWQQQRRQQQQQQGLQGKRTLAASIDCENDDNGHADSNNDNNVNNVNNDGNNGNQTKSTLEMRSRVRKSIKPCYAQLQVTDAEFHQWRRRRRRRRRRRCRCRRRLRLLCSLTEPKLISSQWSFWRNIFRQKVEPCFYSSCFSPTTFVTRKTRKLRNWASMKPKPTLSGKNRSTYLFYSQWCQNARPYRKEISLPCSAQWLAHLLLGPAVPGLIPSAPKIFFRQIKYCSNG